MPTAILVDGDFFLRRYRHLKGGAKSAEQTANDLHLMCRMHLEIDRSKGKKRPKHPGRARKLYRIFFYDCPPLMKKAHNPVTGKAVDFAKTATAKWRLAFHAELRKKRKMALRLGYLNEGQGKWLLRPQTVKELCNRKRLVDDLVEDDVYYDVTQKGVDMRIGLDIASMAYKRQVDQIVLVAGDSDFVPAAKLARREGIDFILDPMWAPIRPDLHEHIDGLWSAFPKSNARADGNAGLPEGS